MKEYFSGIIELYKVVCDIRGMLHGLVSYNQNYSHCSDNFVGTFSQ